MLTDRDILSLALFALADLDNRICQQRNSVNFIGTLMETANLAHLTQCAEEVIPSFTNLQLIDFALDQLEHLKARQEANRS